MILECTDLFLTTYQVVFIVIFRKPDKYLEIVCRVCQNVLPEGETIESHFEKNHPRSNFATDEDIEDAFDSFATKSKWDDDSENEVDINQNKNTEARVGRVLFKYQVSQKKCLFLIETFSDTVGELF